MKTLKEMLDLKDRALTLAARALSDNEDVCTKVCPLKQPCGFVLGQHTPEYYCVPRIIAELEKQADSAS